MARYQRSSHADVIEPETVCGSEDARHLFRSEDIRCKVWPWLFGQPRYETLTSAAGHCPCKLGPHGVFCIERPVAVCDTGSPPLLDKCLGDVCLGESFIVGKVINLLQYPLRPVRTDALRQLDLKQMLHIWCKHAAIVKLLSHRTHLLSAYKNSLQSQEQAMHTSVMSGGLFSSMPEWSGCCGVQATRI